MSKQSRQPQPVLDDATVATIAGAVKPQTLPAERRDALRTRLMERIRDAPPPEGTVTIRAADNEWLWVDPLVEMKILHLDAQNNVQTALWRLQPGAQVIGHPHSMEEECLVLEGEIRFGEHVVRAGDMHLARAGCVHPTLESPRGALLLVRAEIRDPPGS
jgi:quercetin dioxygenase-like cupin family protein